VPSGLFRPTATPDVEPVDAAPEASEEQGRGDAATAMEPRAARPRRKRTPLAGETHGRKLSLPDAVFDRLLLLSIQRRTTVSAIAAEILDRNLPRLRIERD
jgi:hypothetical protein